MVTRLTSSPRARVVRRPGGVGARLLLRLTAMKRAHTGRARPLVVLTSLVLLLLLLAPGVAAAGLKDKITAALARYGMGGSGTSVAVFDLTAKRSLYQLRQDVLRLPASNEKLVTSSTALARWTAAFRFSTQLFIDAPGPDAERRRRTATCTCAASATPRSRRPRSSRATTAWRPAISTTSSPACRTSA